MEVDRQARPSSEMFEDDFDVLQSSLPESDPAGSVTKSEVGIEGFRIRVQRLSFIDQQVLYFS